MTLNLKNVLIPVFILWMGHAFAQDKSINQFDEQGHRHGLWKKYYKNSDQLRYTGKFEHGEEVGTFKFYKPESEGQPAATKTYHPHSDTVILKFYNPKGRLITEGKMLHKKRVGAWNYYKGSKQHPLVMTEHYKNDQLEGWKIVYYENGQITAKKHYKNGMKNGKVLIYAKNGQLLQQYHYVNDTLEGYSKVYNASGHLLSEGAYKKGLRDGKWKFYTQGKLDSIQQYPIIRK